MNDETTERPRPDYAKMIRSREITVPYKVCLDPSLVKAREVLGSPGDDPEALADATTLDEQIDEASVVILLRGLREEETWALSVQYRDDPDDDAQTRAQRARESNRAHVMAAFVRWETLDGEPIESLTKDHLVELYDTMTQGQMVNLVAAVVELAYTPALPTSAPRSQKTTG